MRPRVHSEREDWLQQMVAAGVGYVHCRNARQSSGIALRPVAGLDLSREVSLVAVSGSGNPREARQIPDHGSTVRLGRIKPTVPRAAITTIAPAIGRFWGNRLSSAHGN